MITTTYNPSTDQALKGMIRRSLERDRQNALNYARLCKGYMREAENDGDTETVQFWAAIHDQQQEQISFIAKTLKQYES